MVRKRMKQSVASCFTLLGEMKSYEEICMAMLLELSSINIHFTIAFLVLSHFQFFMTTKSIHMHINNCARYLETLNLSLLVYFSFSLHSLLYVTLNFITFSYVYMIT